MPEEAGVGYLWKWIIKTRVSFITCFSSFILKKKTHIWWEESSLFFYKNGDSSRKINHYYIFDSKFCKLWLNIYRRGSHFAHNLKCGQGIYMITIFSCGKVVFQSSLSVQGGPMWPLTAGHQMLAPMGVPITHDTLDLTVQGILLNMDPYCTGAFYRPILEICSNFFTWGPPPLSVLTSGGYWSMYGWQAGGTHPIGKRSCLGKEHVEVWMMLVVNYCWTIDCIYNKKPFNFLEIILVFWVPWRGWWNGMVLELSFCVDKPY